MNLFLSITTLAAIQLGGTPSGGEHVDPTSPPAATVVEYDGSAGEIAVGTPIIVDAEIDIDGRIDEAVWGQAALLGFPDPG